jgi:hypothetical protein
MMMDTKVAKITRSWTSPVMTGFGESMTSATNLGVFVQSFLEDTSFVARLLGWFDMFIIWGLLVTAIGFGVLYKRKTAPIFWTFMGIYVVIALIGATFMKG